MRNFIASEYSIKACRSGKELCRKHRVILHTFKEIFVGIISRIAGMAVTLFIPFIQTNAQLCQGSLGDPIVNITFGSGSNPGPSLTAATTAYQFVYTDCPQDGFYTVRNSTYNCFGNTWFSFTTDHTGDPNGYFMLVNAAYEPSAFYLDTVKGLCGSTTYEFAAWIMNVLLQSACNFSGIKPNLTFSIENKDGSLLQSYNTNDIPVDPGHHWKQFGFFFTTPPGVSDVVLRIFNNAKGGCGNDLALDDITFRPCGPQITASINGYSSDTVTYCEGESHAFTFSGTVSAGFTNPSLQWQESISGGTWTDIPGATTNSLGKNFPSGTVPGTYAFRLSAAEAGNMGSPNCRVASTELRIEVAAIPVTSISSNSPVCEESTISLAANGSANYQWNGVNNFSATGDTVTIGNAQLNQAGKYYMLATSAAGCIYLDSVMVIVNPKPLAVTDFSSATICEGDHIQLESSGGIAYQWIPAKNLSSAAIPNPSASPADTTVYMIIVSNGFACTDTALITINAIEKPRANAGHDRTIIEGNATELLGTVSGQDISYSWSPSLYISNIQSLQPIVNPPADMDYTLSVVSEIGCGVAIDTVHVFVYKDVFVPTAFTPNGDGLNDTWYIPPLNAFKSFEVSVYNRYGRIVFQTKNSNLPWDGNFRGVPQPMGVYVYLINLKETGRILKGTVALIR
jgi:gliding motility-associated-like protein